MLEGLGFWQGIRTRSWSLRFQLFNISLILLSISGSFYLLCTFGREICRYFAFEFIGAVVQTQFGLLQTFFLRALFVNTIRLRSLYL